MYIRGTDGEIDEEKKGSRKIEEKTVEAEVRRETERRKRRREEKWKKKKKKRNGGREDSRREKSGSGEKNRDGGR